MGSLKLAVASDEAFCFYYRDNLRELERAGFETVLFSPLADRALPEGVSGLYIGGGYPELHAKRLSENKEMLRSVQDAVGAGLPTVAECGGFMYLTRAIHVPDESGEESAHPMCGVIDTVCQKHDRLVRFGYAEVSDETGLWVDFGERIRGHEFHYYDTEDNGSDARITKASTGKEYREIHISDTMWAGWPHLYFRSCRKFTEAFAEKCRGF